MHFASLTLSDTIGYISVALTLITGVYTLWRIWKGTIKPHVFSVFIWFLLTSIAFANMLFSQDAGAAAYRTGLMALILLANFCLSSRFGIGYIRRSDWFFLTAALAVVPIWLLTDMPDLALLILLAIEVMGTVPTITKCYHRPHDLSPGVYFFTATAQALQLLALLTSTETHSFALVLFLGTFPAIFFSLSLMLVIRRKQVVPQA